ncbi:MAG: GC-type dockerin domain-anchored protein [Planctomycetota bacterium]|nr:GC-type dockerin domain-anchored protein [Planctomycetota bacterium]
MKRVLPASIVLCMVAAAGNAQVVISEVFANPAGSSGQGDNRWEFIELYGKPGMSLDGYAILPVFGGSDTDGDGLPGPLPAGWDVGDEFPEIDEGWSLDGLTIGSNGFLVLYQNRGAPANPSFIPGLLPAATTRADFAQTYIPSFDVSGAIKNDGSATWVLVRKRPGHSLNGLGQSVYAPNYAWKKDIDPDTNFNSRIDFGFETPTILQPSPSILEPYQMVDDIAISNGGGKEYTRSNDQRVSDTPGYNPDAFCRVGYFFTNPNLGDRINSSSVVVPTTSADEEFVYGDVPNNAALAFDPTFSGGPTAPGQPLGSRFNDLSRTGFKITPGTFNDGGNFTQFRFVNGDVNFDGVVNCADVALATSYLGATLDDTETKTNNQNTVDTADDVTYTGWKWEGRAFNSVFATLNMVNDGGAVTAADVAAIEALVSGGCAPACPADFNNDGFLDFTDFDDFVGAFEAGLSSSDFNGDGFLDFTDFDAFVAAFETGC